MFKDSTAVFAERPSAEAQHPFVVALRNKLVQEGTLVESSGLYANGDFRTKLEQTFEGDYTLRFNLAPPLLAKKDASGMPLKLEYGCWVMPAFALLARLRGLRRFGGGFFDIFGRTPQRRMERTLIHVYREMIEGLLPQLSEASLAIAVEIASIPEHIRGYGHVKLCSVEKARHSWQELQQRFDAGPSELAA